MKEYKAYLFDLDLTSLDTVASSISSYVLSFKEVGAIFDESTILHNLSIPITQTFDEIEKKQGTLKRFVDVFNNESNNTFKDSKFFEDSIRYFNYLYSKNKTMGIITNRKDQNIKDILTKYGLDKMFKVTVSCDDVKHIKPYPDPMFKALEKLGLDAKDVVYFGDTINDKIACDKSNIDFIRVNRFNTTSFDSKETIISFDELIK